MEPSSTAATIAVAAADTVADIAEDILAAADIAAAASVMPGLAQVRHFAAIVTAELFVALSMVEFDHLPSVIPPSLRIPLW